MKHSLII